LFADGVSKQRKLSHMRFQEGKKTVGLSHTYAFSRVKVLFVDFIFQIQLFLCFWITALFIMYIC